jgi:hypothetical protein
MTILKVSVKNNEDANTLVRMLKKLSFVQDVEKLEPETTEVSDQYASLSEIIDQQASPALFQEIEDPIHWQKALRDEWE